MRLFPFALLALAGCQNFVVSQAPWFTGRDEAGAAPLRQGLWALDHGDECRFDERRPMEQWPDCAQAFVIRSGETLRVQNVTGTEHGRKAEDYEWASQPYVLASGNPRIYQRENCATFNPVEYPYEYCYDALRPSKVDSNGSITGFVIWTIYCGPLSPPTRKKGSVGETDRELFPELRVYGQNCIADSAQAVRDAAAKSELTVASTRKLMDATMRASKSRKAKQETALLALFLDQSAHWVREGYR